MRLFRRLLLAAASAALLASVANAQSAESRTDTVGLRPTLDWVAEWPVPGANRRVKIHRADETEEGQQNTFVHRPLLAFIETDTPPEGFPNIVHDMDTGLDGTVYLLFRIAISTPEFRQFMLQVLSEQAADEIARAGARVDEAEMQAWPVTHVVVVCEDRILKDGDEPLEYAADRSNSIDSNDTYFEVRLGLDPARVPLFLERLESDDILFDFRYTFSSRSVVRAEEVIEGSIEISSLVRNSLSSAQRDGELAIFQGHINQVKRAVHASVTRRVRSQSPEHFPWIADSSAIDRLFEFDRAVTFEELAGDEVLRAQVADYLAPLIDEFVRETKLTRTQTDMEQITDKEEVEFALPEIEVEGFGLRGGPKIKLTHEEIQRFTDETGLEVRFQETERRYVPYAIRVHKLADGWENVSLSAQHFGVVATGRNTDYFDDTPVAPSYRLSSVLQDLSYDVTEWSLSGVPLGTMLPWFGGGTAPAGYVFADGNSTWPDESWVPQHLRGKPVPNMEARAAFGAGAEDAVGSHQDAGSFSYRPVITLPSLRTTGSANYSIWGLKPERQALNGDGSFLRFSPGQEDRFKADWSISGVHLWTHNGDGVIQNYGHAGGPFGRGANSRQLAGATLLTRTEFGTISGVRYRNDGSPRWNRDNRTITLDRLSMTLDSDQLPHVKVRWIIRVGR